MHRAFFFLALTIPWVATGGRASAQATPSTAGKIANAMAAAPASISANAAVMDWPASEGEQMTTLRPGSNGWTCLPDFPGTDGNDPMCLDEQWMGFMHAMMSKGTPNVTRVGVGYMIASGGASGSNTDPFATKPTADNEWGFDPPHVMLVVTDTKALEGIPTTRQNGGPWVMWSGTPYAHIMVPIASSKK